MVMTIYYTYLKYIAFALLALALPFIGLLVLKIIQRLTTGKCRSLVCLTGKTAVVSGGNSGIGFETALVLASRGCRVILADRTDGTAAKEKITELTNNYSVEAKHLDLSSLDSVREFAKEINETEERLDILINNPGSGSHHGHKYTDDGFHSTMQINHFGPFLLTHLLIDLLKKSAPSRIIFVSSANAYVNNLTKSNLNITKEQRPSMLTNFFLYGNSKLCNVITAIGFAERLKEFDISSNSLHPGLVSTDFSFKLSQAASIRGIRKMITWIVIYLYGKSQEEGAQTIIHLALSRKLRNVTGKYFWDCRMFPTPPGAWSKKFCNDIWEESEAIVNLTDEQKLVLPQPEAIIEEISGKEE